MMGPTRLVKSLRALAILSTAVVSGCSWGAAPHIYGPLTMVGQVRGKDGKTGESLGPLEGAFVSAGPVDNSWGASAECDHTGAYELTLNDEGFYNVTTQHDYFTTKNYDNLDITNRKNAYYPLNVTLTRPWGDVIVKVVKDSSGGLIPVAGVRTALTDPGLTMIERVDTDSNGIARYSVPAGEWEAVAISPDPSLIARETEVVYHVSRKIDQGQVTEVTLMLTPAIMGPSASPRVQPDDPSATSPSSSDEGRRSAPSVAERPSAATAPAVAEALSKPAPTPAPSPTAGAPVAATSATPSASPPVSPPRSPRRKGRPASAANADPLAQLGPELRRRNVEGHAKPIDDDAVKQAFPGVAIVPVPSQPEASSPSASAGPSAADKMSGYFERDFLVAHPDGHTEVLSGRGAVLKFVREHIPVSSESDAQKAAKAFMALATKKYPELQFGPTELHPTEADDSGHVIVAEAPVTSGGTGKLVVGLNFKSNWKLAGATIRKVPTVK